VALKKPSDFFGKDSNNKKETIVSQDQVIPESINAYKDNLKNIQTLNEFTENFGSFADNIAKINDLEKSILELKEEIKNTLTQKDLDSAMMSNLLVLEENINHIQNNLEGINQENLQEIYNDVENVVSLVENFAEELPTYKNLIKSNEVSLDKKLIVYRQQVEEKLEEFDQTIDDRFSVIVENLEGINEEALSEIASQVNDIDNTVNDSISKYKNQVLEKTIQIDEKFSDFQENILSNLNEYRQELENEITEVQKSVKEFVDGEIPKYQNLLTSVKVDNDKKIEELVNKFSYKIKSLSENAQQLNDEVENRARSLDQSFTSQIEKLEEHILKVKKEAEDTNTTYKKLYNVIEAKGLRDTNQFDILENTISSLANQIENAYQKIENTRESIEDQEREYQEFYQEELKKVQEQFSKKLNLLENDIESKNKKIKETNETLVEDVTSLKEKVQSFPKLEKDYDKIQKKLSFIEEAFNKVSEKTLLKEDGSLLTGTEKERTKDPLTPLDKNFVTFGDLSNHYRQFINRIQIQLASIGGGGAGFIKDLDDVDFDQTSGDGKLLIYNQSLSKWVGIASTSFSSGGSVATSDIWSVDAVGIHTTKSVSIGTTSADPNYRLLVDGDVKITGNISVAGTVTYDDVTNIDSIGIITAREDVTVQRNLFVSGITTLGASNGIGTVYVGLGSTALYVDGDARITGILTVGRSSVTIDGDNNTITAGDILITGSSITIGDNVTINAGATGINSAPNVLYVAKDGNDANNGTSIDNAKLTIAGAVSIAQSGTVIKVLSGTYNENNPIEVPAFVSIVGDSLKTVTVVPNNSTEDIFHVNKGTYLSNMTFTGHTSPAAAVAFPPTIAENTGGGSWESPYVQNCTSNTTTGTGMRIDGSLAEGLKSMVVDSYTQYNQGGVGIAITNNGYAQLVSVFTICCNEAITAHKGGQCSLTNSNTDFGTYGLIADGVSDLQFVGTASSATVATDTVTVAVTTTTRPYEGQVMYFDTLYQSIETITITNNGSGYTVAPTVSISAPAGPNGIAATAFATIENGSVTEITIIGGGTQYTEAPTITISAPDSGTTATATANMTPIYYTINSSTPIVSGITTVTLEENLNNTVSTGATAYFYQVSKITSSSHTFEYVGAGNTISLATPSRGGVPIPGNEIIERSGGRVVYTSTDQSGNFRIGNDITINQNTGTISGRAFTRSLFNQMTPFILALS
jgi:hypothetical protein